MGMLTEGFGINAGAVADFNGKIVQNDSVFRNVARLKEDLRAIDLPLELKFMILTAQDSKGNIDVPLILPVNPDDFKVDYKKKVNIDYTFGGFVLNHWHEDVMTITGSGYIPSFESRAKILTTSYTHFKRLLDIYTKCGQVQPNYTPVAVSSNVDNSIATGSQVNGTAAVSGAKSGTATAMDQLKLQGVDTSSNKVVDGTSTDAINMKVSTFNIQWVKVCLIYQSEMFTGVFTDFDTHEKYDEPNTLKYSFIFKAMEKQDLSSFMPPYVSGALNIANGIISLGSSLAGSNPDALPGNASWK